MNREELHFTPEEQRRGWSFRGNTKVYCCYGMYCDAGHDSSCEYQAREQDQQTAQAAGEKV